LKTIPIALQTHKNLPVTTLCRLLKIACRNGTTFGFANLDQDVIYDDDAGAGSPSDGRVRYLSANGFVPSRLSAAAGTSVDNSDLAGVISEIDELGITEEQIRSGLLDYADAYVYEVNYEDVAELENDGTRILTTGIHELKARGKCGQVSMVGQGFVAEFRSLTQLFKQPIGEVTSLTCRAQFGDTRCGKGLTWVTATITDVSLTEPDRIFSASGLGEAAAHYEPGVVRFTGGQNEGAEVEVETFAAGVVSLSLPVYFDLQVGDTFEIRQDCSKVWDDDAHGCLYHWPSERALHFRGEPHIPVGQEGELSTPGAELD
jgi:uncharacterized phage protein (TIGR02218 family)